MAQKKISIPEIVVLDEATAYQFAADCAEHVYYMIDHLDLGEGTLREAIESARSGDPARVARARRASHKTIRRLARAGHPKNLLSAARAARTCTKDSGREAAVSAAWLAAEACQVPDEEILWQISHLSEIVA